MYPRFQQATPYVAPIRFAKGCGSSSVAQHQTEGIHANQPRVLCTMLKLSGLVRK